MGEGRGSRHEALCALRTMGLQLGGGERASSSNFSVDPAELAGSCLSYGLGMLFNSSSTSSCFSPSVTRDNKLLLHRVVKTARLLVIIYVVT